MQWLHEQCGKIEIWWGNLRIKNKPAYYGLKILPWIVAFIGLSPILSLLQKGWLVILGKIVGFIVFIVIFVIAFKKTEKRGFLFWQPWLLALALAIVFLFFRLQGNAPPQASASQTASSENSSTIWNTTDDQLVTLADATFKAAKRLGDVKDYEGTYVDYFFLSLKRSEYWSKSVWVATDLADAYQNNNRPDDATNATKAAVAISKMLQSPVHNLESPEMRPAFEFYNKLNGSSVNPRLSPK